MVLGCWVMIFIIIGKKMSRKHVKKITNEVLTEALLKKRTDILANAGYEQPKWIGFSQRLITEGFTLELYEARKTFSKYITIFKDGFKPYKVRFSNHMPIERRELAGDCDFFVGKTHTGIRNTGMALNAVMAHFEHGKYDLSKEA